MPTDAKATFKEKIENAEGHARTRMREKFRDRLQSFVGTSGYRRRGRLFYTDGLKYLSDEAEAHWFLTVLKSYVPHILDQMRKTELGPHTASLTVDEMGGTVRLYDDWLPSPDVSFGGSPDMSPYHEQYIPYTDFPLSDIKIVLGPAVDGPVIESVEEVKGIIASLPTES